jgi:hypothetical protein
MDIRIFDIILLFVLILTVSMIIGYNIVFIIDKKISSVTINVPPIKVPTPQVTLYVQPGLNGDLRFNTYEQNPYVANMNNTGFRKITV